MQNKLIQYFSELIVLSDEERQDIEESMVVKEYRKGDYLLKEGQIASDTYFVMKGLVREFILLEGEEKTTNFYSENQWIISLDMTAPVQPSVHNWVCAEDCILVAGNERMSIELFQRHPRLEAVSRMVMEKTFAAQQQQLTSYITDSPEQRYLKLLKYRPDIIQRVPQYQIAGYIGVKPESLSRIRKRIALK